VSVSLIIPCHNEGAVIESCLRSVLAQDQLGEDTEILVIDGRSDDGTRQILERFAKTDTRVRILDNPERIVSTGLNAGIRAARGDTLIRLDAHTEYAPDYVRSCREVLAETGADNVGGPVRTRAYTPLQKAIAAAYHSPFSTGGARFHRPGYEGWADTVPYGCWRRITFEKFGFFDETLVRNQDDEHNLRIVRGGGRIWQSPRIRSWYQPRAALGSLFAQYAQYGYWKVRVIQKHRLPGSWRHLIPGVFLLTLMSLALAALVATVPAFHWLSFAPRCLQVLGGCYGLGLACASIATAKQTDWRLLPLLLLVFPCYHAGYGWGFLRGALDFLIMRRGARGSFARITRKTGCQDPT